MQTLNLLLAFGNAMRHRVEAPNGDARGGLS